MVTYGSEIYSPILVKFKLSVVNKNLAISNGDSSIILLLIKNSIAYK